ncbi:hypothetical protein A0H81_02124 [Grifola frondosa]|uniref:Uncharacterized protein n=1 Tax=Grifola frondosa TaxID=5627 RepID=A0A1C7MQ17_GRIFR|nr:hypothetical protein A0H81_02124 [Grifola frondosa]
MASSEPRTPDFALRDPLMTRHHSRKTLWTVRVQTNQESTLLGAGSLVQYNGSRITYCPYDCPRSPVPLYNDGALLAERPYLPQEAADVRTVSPTRKIRADITRRVVILLFERVGSILFYLDHWTSAVIFYIFRQEDAFGWYLRVPTTSLSMLACVIATTMKLQDRMLRPPPKRCLARDQSHDMFTVLQIRMVLRCHLVGFSLMMSTPHSSGHPILSELYYVTAFTC